MAVRRARGGLVRDCASPLRRGPTGQPTAPDLASRLGRAPPRLGLGFPGFAEPSPRILLAAAAGAHCLRRVLGHRRLLVTLQGGEPAAEVVGVDLASCEPLFEDSTGTRVAARLREPPHCPDTKGHERPEDDDRGDPHRPPHLVHPRSVHVCHLLLLVRPSRVYSYSRLDVLPMGASTQTLGLFRGGGPFRRSDHPVRCSSSCDASSCGRTYMAPPCSGAP